MLGWVCVLRSGAPSEVRCCHVDLTKPRKAERGRVCWVTSRVLEQLLASRRETRSNKWKGMPRRRWEEEERRTEDSRAGSGVSMTMVTSLMEPFWVSAKNVGGIN